METDLFPEYSLDDFLDNNTPNGDNGINDNHDDESCINDNKENKARNHHNDHNDDDNDNNHDNDNGDQTLMILQAMHFGEKAEFCESAQTRMCLHSANCPCPIYRREL